MAQKNINSGKSPITWSSVNNALKDVNDNFTELYGLLSFSVNPTNLSSSLIPSFDNTYDLGTFSNRWKDLYLTGSTIYLGSAQISTNLNGGVNLPENSTISGSLIDSGPIFRFTTINVTGQPSIQANTESDNFTISPGVGAFITMGDNNTINVSFDQSIDIFGSVYSTSEQLLIDSVNGKIVGPIDVTVNEIKVTGGAAGQVLSTDGLGNLSFVDQSSGGIGDTGNVTFTENIIDSSNSEPIVFEPEVIFNSTIQAAEFVSTAVGVPELFSETNLNLSAVNAVVITQSPLRLAQYTTTERNLITAQNGDIIYNVTDNKFQGYQNGSWINLDGSGAI